jgi:flavin reductase (DIM6/NTAB) family NADH-FMN oxidoreductase RutF
MVSQHGGRVPGQNPLPPDSVPKERRSRMLDTIQPVELQNAYRLITHGPTVLVSARAGGVDDVMSAAWACALDFSPPKLTVVLDSRTKTRELVEASGTLVIQVPTVAQLKLTDAVGNMGLREVPDKLARAGVELFGIDGHDLPFVAGCSAWLACRVLPEPHVQKTYDLFVAEVTGAWADSRVFAQGHWRFEQAPREWRSLHHVAGGHYYATGEPLDA